jgi:tetratricopeptide (TPR) repeat protein
MKRTVSIVSLTAIVACGAALFGMFRIPSRGAVGKSAFPVGVTHTVHFGPPLEEASDADPADQFRDWLLYAVLEESGLDSEALRKALYDVPAERAGFTLPVGAFEFGEMRSRIVGGEGTVVALVPKLAPKDGANRHDQLAQIADAALTSLGTRPRRLEVFEYTVDPAELVGTVTRLPDIAGEKLFTPEYGFTEKAISSAADLESFLSATDDVSSVEFTDGSLRVSGRNTGQKIGRMRLEDVAALWQSEKSLAADKSRIDEFNAKWRTDSYLESVAEEEYKKQLAAIPGGAGEESAPADSNPFSTSSQLGLNDLKTDEDAERLLKPRRVFPDPTDLAQKYPEGAVGSAARAALERRFKDKEYLRGLLQKRHDAEEAELKASLSSKGSEGIPQGSGFSLDPSFDYKELESVFNVVQSILPPEELENIRNHIRNRDEGPFLDALYKVQQDKSNKVGAFLAPMATELLNKAKFQHARYDGSLAGTEDGMVLFYTDLLAKLWALDYFDRAPEQQIRGFVPLLKVSISPIYQEEERQLSGTRLWFGPRDNGYSKLKNGLAFSRVATRVYAASSNTLQPGKEAQANATSSRFLGWWNDRYAQVAEFEPQYKRLNQIMKWSVILGWLPSTAGLDRMSYLADVPVKRDNWFPDWAKGNADLKFRDWTRESNCPNGRHQSVRFYDKGYLGVDTESMPILYSCDWGKNEDEHSFSGGVSLGSRAEVEARAALADTVDETARRANLEPIPALENETLAVQTTDKTTFRFAQVANGEPAEVKALAAVKLRGDEVELKGAPIKSSFRKDPSGLTVKVSAGGHPVSELVIRHRPGSADIDILELPRLQENARSIGRTIGRAAEDSESSIAAVAARPEVARAVEANGNIYVQVRDTPQTWIRYRPEGAPRMDIAADANMRMGFATGSRGNSSRWDAAFIDSNTANKEMASAGRYLVPDDSRGARPGVAFSVNGRGPPPTGHAPPAIDLGDVPPEKRDVIAAIGGGSNHGPRGPNPPNGGEGGGGGGGGGNEGGGGGGGDSFNGASFGPDEVGRKAINEPDALFAWIEGNRRAKLNAADEYIKQGKFDEAIRELDGAAAVMPNDPDILLRRAIAKAGSHSADRARAASRLNLKPSEMPDFVARLDVAAQHLSGAEADDLYALYVGTTAKSQGRQARYFYKPDNSMGVEVAIIDARKGAEASAVTGDLRYTFATVDTAPAGKIVEAIPPPSRPLRIEDDVVARLEPDRIYDQTSGHRYDRVGAEASATGRFGPPFRGGPPNSYRNLWNSFTGCDGLSEQERANRTDCRRTFVVDGGDRTLRASD